MNRLSLDQSIQGRSGAYRLKAFLGEGLAATVYRAIRESDGQAVAVKSLRPGAAPLTQEYFWSEGIVVGELIAGGASGIPRKLDEQSEGEPPHFLVFEYVDPSQFQPLTDRLEKDPIPEQEALEIAIQALAVLDILHNKVGRTYTDMQLRNFWWDAQTRSLRVMDWNHVSRKREEIDNIGKIEDPDLRRKREEELAKLGARNFNDLVANDLGRLASFIYQMLTGKGASPRGETQRDMETRAGGTWQTLSLAARQALRQALHPNLQMRFTSAARMSAALQQVQELWNWQEGDAEAYLKLIYQTAENAEKAQPGSPEGLQDIDRAYALLDMIERQDAGFKVPRERARKKLDEVTQRVSQEWGRGMNLFNGDQFLAAYSILKEEAISLGRLDLWRWVLLAKAGADQPTLLKRDSPDRQIFLNALQEMNQGDFQKALANLLIHKTARTNTLQILEGEIRMQFIATQARLLTDSSRPDDWGKAAGLLRQVEEWLVSAAVEWPEYVRLLRSEAGWQNLTDEASLLNDRLAAHNTSMEMLSKITYLWPDQFAAGLTELHQALRCAPANPDLLRLCLEPPLSDPEQVQQVVEAGVLLGSHAEYSPRLRQKLAEVRAQGRQQARRQAFEQALHEIEQAVEHGPWSELPELILHLPDNPELRQGKRFHHLLMRIQELFDVQAELVNLPSMHQLDQTLHALGAPGAEQRQAAIRKASATLQDEKGLLERRNNELKLIEEERKKLALEQRFHEFRQWCETNPPTRPKDLELLAQKAGEKFPDLVEQQDFRDWRAGLEQDRQRLVVRQQIQDRLLWAEDSIRTLRREELNKAVKALNEARHWLKSLERSDELGKSVEVHSAWLEEISRSSLPEQFTQLQELCREIERRLEKLDQPIPKLVQEANQKLRIVLQIGRIEYWQDALKMRAPLYPALDQLRQVIQRWEKAFPDETQIASFQSPAGAAVDIDKRLGEQKTAWENKWRQLTDQVVSLKERIGALESAPKYKKPHSGARSIGWEIARFILAIIAVLIFAGVCYWVYETRFEVVSIQRQLYGLQQTLSATSPRQATKAPPTLAAPQTATPHTATETPFDTVWPSETYPVSTAIPTPVPTSIATDLQVEIVAQFYNLPVVITGTETLTNTYYYDLPPLKLISSLPSKTKYGLAITNEGMGLELHNSLGSAVVLQLILYPDGGSLGQPQAVLAKPGQPNEKLTVYLAPSAQGKPLAPGSYRLALEDKQNPGQALWENQISVIAAQTTLTLTSGTINTVLFPSYLNPQSISSKARSSDEETTGITDKTIFDVIGKTLTPDRSVIRWLLLRRQGSRQLFWGFHIIRPLAFVFLSSSPEITIADFCIPIIEELPVEVP